MEKLWFEEKWRKLIMQCVTSMSFSVRINGKPRGHIVPTRGIRQGDPLSPMGAVFKVWKAAGVGVVIRDSHGQVVAVLSKKINSPLGPLEIEAKAFEAGLQFAKDVDIYDFIVEVDSLVVYNALCDHSTPPSSVAHVISGMLKNYGACYRIEFSHTRRQDNKPNSLVSKICFRH